MKIYRLFLFAPLVLLLKCVPYTYSSSSTSHQYIYTPQIQEKNIQVENNPFQVLFAEGARKSGARQQLDALDMHSLKLITF